MDAQSEARALGSESVGTQHLLLAATLQKDPVQRELQNVGVTAEAVRTQLSGKSGMESGLNRLFSAASKDELLPFGKDTERALKAAVTRCKEEGRVDELITWRELLLSVLRDDSADNAALSLLRTMDISPDAAYSAVARSDLEKVGAGGEKEAQKTTLEQCSTDLTKQAREVKLATQILVRRRKNNPVLIGDPGVGKTAIAEGL